MRPNKDKQKLDDIYELIWTDTEQAWAAALEALERHKSASLNYLSARAQMLVYIISIIIRGPGGTGVDIYALKKFFQSHGHTKDAALLTLWMTRNRKLRGNLEESEALEAEYEEKYASTAPLTHKIMRMVLKGNFNMMRDLNKTAQVELAIQAEAMLRADPQDSAEYRINLSNVLQLKAEAMSHTGEIEMVNAAINEATELVDVPETSPYYAFATYYFKGNVAAVAGRTQEALATYRKLEDRFRGKSFYNGLLIYVYIQIFKQLNEQFAKQGLSDTPKAELISDQIKYLDLAKSLMPGQNRPYLVSYMHLTEARLMRATRQYAEAISLLAKALPFFVRNNLNNHVIDVWEEAYQSYREWAEASRDYRQYRRAVKALTNANTLTHRYNQIEGKERIDSVINRYELQKKELSEKLLHQKMDAMNKEMQLTALNLHEKVQVLGELKGYVNSLQQKGKETNKLIHTIAKKIDAVIITEQDKSTLQQKIDETNADFFKILSERCPTLSNLEIRMCALLKTGMTNKELSKLYGQSEKSYEQHRYRIKKKLGLTGKDNLVRFLVALR